MRRIFIYSLQQNMKNKKTLLRLGLFAMVMWCFGISYTSALTRFHINSERIQSLSTDNLTNKIIPIHFADNWNDFGGFFYFSNGIWGNSEWEEWWEEWWEEYYGISISSWHDIAAYECNRQVKWFYYNGERWERLRPLDKGTWSDGLQDKITTSWWLYTVCSKSGYVAALETCKNLGADQDSRVCEDNVKKAFPTDEHWYYGQLIHEFSWQKMILTVWVNYTNYEPNSHGFIKMDSDGWFSPSFIRIWNQYPAWFIYDQNWWVGFVLCRVGSGTNDTGAMKRFLSNYYALLNWSNWENSSPLNSLFYETGDNIDYIRQNDDIVGYKDVYVNCSNAVRDALIPIVIEWIVGMGQSWNSANFEYQKNEMNDKMQFLSSSDINSNTIINYARKKAELLCRWKWNKNGTCYKNPTSPINANPWEIYIVKNWDVKIKPLNSLQSDHYNIFIDSWNLIIEEDNDKRYVFDNNWFPVNYNKDDFWEAVGRDRSNYRENYVAVASFLKWNFIVNWRITGENGSWLNNRYFIHWKISTRDTLGTLTETFKWRCNNWIDSQEKPCPQTSPIKRNENGEIIEGSSWNNPYEAAALVVIDQKYDSPFFNNY